MLKKILLVPGIGDIHWALKKLQSWLLRRGWADPEVWIWDIDGRPRALEYLSYIPWLKPGGYWRQDLVGDVKLTWNQLYHHQGSPDYVLDFCGFDAFVGLNGNMRNGVPFAVLLEGAEVNHGYGPSGFPDYYGQKHREEGPYFVLAFSDFGAFRKHWCSVMNPQVIQGLVERLHQSFPGHRFLFTGCRWDLYFTKQLVTTERDEILVGQTSISDHLSLLNRSDGFLGFCAGSAMMAQHLGTPTVVWWSRVYFPRHDRRGWETPHPKKNHLVLDVEAYLEKETPRVVTDFLKWGVRRT